MTAMKTPALDFCQKVSTWQEAEGAAAGLPMLMPDSERGTLNRILQLLAEDGASTALEASARYWLIRYRELESQQQVLTTAQRAELNQVVDGIQSERPARKRRTWRGSWRVPVIGGALAILLGGGVLVYNGMQASSPVPPGNAAPVNPGQQLPAGNTGLGQFASDWGPFTQLPASVQDPQTGAPALVLLNDGKYLVSSWYLPAGNPAWAPDMSGSVGSVVMHGSYAVITDADGGIWAVGIGQPFVLAQNPSVVLIITKAGDVLSMPESHAVVIRSHSK